MATQDGRDFDFGKAALSVLSGAAAGAGTSNIGLGFGAGLATVEQQRERERQRAIQDRQLQQRDVLTQQRIESGELGIQEQRARAQQRIDQQATSGFKEEFDAIMKLNEPNRMRYQKDNISKATRKLQTDGALSYGMNEIQGELIDSRTRASDTMALTDAYLFSLHRSITSTNPAERAAADRMQRIIGLQLGNEYVPAQGNKPAMIKTDYGIFPAELASAQKIKDATHAEVESVRKNYEHHFRTRNLIGYAAEDTMYQGMANMFDLKTGQLGKFAQGYLDEVQGNDFLGRNLTVAHGMDRILKGKDPDQTKYELAELSNILDKAGVKYHPDPNGDFFIDAGGFNKFVNQYNTLDNKVSVLDKTGMVKVDEDLVKKIYNRSGLNSARDRWIGRAQTLNDRIGLAKREALGFKEQAATREQLRQAGVKSQIGSAQRRKAVQSLSADIPMVETVSEYSFNIPDNDFTTPNPTGGHTLKPAAQAGVMQVAENRAKSAKEDVFIKKFKRKFDVDIKPDIYINESPQAILEVEKENWEKKDKKTRGAEPTLDSVNKKIERATKWWNDRRFNPESKEGKAATEEQARRYMRQLRNPREFKRFMEEMRSKRNSEDAAISFGKRNGDVLFGDPDKIEVRQPTTAEQLIKRRQK